ncbi:NADH-quinone oxidoreductase subunit D [Luteococcus peritonei]|uniref:NADH-quinone oxidoreductase subunit D n=1 Tax=Luteococcus peritonei TaxID=88874 RepID=A0ABW4RVM2_9ACTN
MPTNLITLGSPAVGLADPDALHADLGPEHPSRTGLLLVEVTTDGDDVVRAARIQPGFNHRSAEKLFELRDYRQVLMLADRHDWHSPFSGELGAALVCEHLMGLVPPQRATWLRTVLAEQARTTSHLAHLSAVCFLTGEEELAADLRALRSTGRELVLAISGNRVHPMLNRLGGLALDVPAGRLEQVAEWMDQAADLAGRLVEVLASSGLGRGLGIVDAALVDDFGLSGPVAAASGLQRDLRLRNPYLCYDRMAEQLSAGFDPHSPGDAAARFRELCRQVDISSRLVRRCTEELAALDGPVDTKLSKIIKIPESEAYLAIEAPWGMAGFHLVSRAGTTPWRLKLRTPSFANVQALEQVLVGTPLQQVDVVLASLGWTNGDLDK